MEMHRPHKFQKLILESKKNIILFLAGVRAGKCVAADTMIAGERIDSFGFEKGTAQLYSVDGLLRTTSEHVLLSPDGWLSVSELLSSSSKQTSVSPSVFYSILSESTPDISLSDFLSGDLSSWKTVADFQSDYLAYFRSNGGQPRQLPTFDQGTVPSPDDALASSFSRQYELERSHLYQSSSRLSSTDDLHHVHRTYDLADRDDVPSYERCPLHIREYLLSDIGLELRTKVLSKVPDRHKSSVASVSLIFYGDYNIYSIAVSINPTITEDKVEAYWDTCIPAIHCYEAGNLISHNTFGGCLWLIKEIYKHPSGNFLVCAPSYKILNQSTLDTFFKVINVREWGKYNKQENIMYLKTGGRIYFRSVDDPDAVEGMTCFAAWLDEADKMKHKAFVNALGRVSAANGNILMTTTPYGLGWVYREIYKPWQNKDPKSKDIDVIECRSIDNPHFNKQSYELAKLQLSTAEFERRYMGQFKRMTGLVYEDILNEFGEIRHESVFDISKGYKVPEICYTIGGIDWGYTDPTAIVIIGVTEDKNLYVLEEFYKTGMTINEVVDKCQELRFKHHVSQYYADPSQPSSIEEMQRRGVPCVKGNNEIPFGISMVRSLLRLDRLHINIQCKNFFEEVLKYHYDEDKPSDVPFDEQNHVMDSLRYPIATHPAIAQIVKMSTAVQADENVLFWSVVKGDIKSETLRGEEEEFNIYQSALTE